MHKELGNRLITYIGMTKESSAQLDGFLKKSRNKYITDQMGKLFKSTSTYA